MRCGLPVLPEELVFMILELSYAPKLLLVPVMRAVWDEVDLFAFMRTVSKRGGVRYPGYFPKYIYEKWFYMKLEKDTFPGNFLFLF